MSIIITQKIKLQKPLLYLLGIIISYLLVIGIASTKLHKYIESKTLDFRFVLKGNHSFSPDLVLVLIDKPTLRAIGESPFPREFFAVLAYGLHLMGAKAIGIDFLFDSHRLPATDSLLTDVIREVDNIVLSYYFRQLYENTDFRDEDSLITQFQRHSLSTNSDERVACYQGESVVLPFDELFYASQNLGHINVSIDEISGAVRELPLIVSYNNRYYPALALTLIKVFWQLSDQQIEIKPGKIVLHPSEQLPIIIPVSDKGEILINYQVNQWRSDNIFSAIDVLERCRKILNDDSTSIQNSYFKNKIVLVGSVVDEDIFETPFSVDYPGIFIHANVINNILQGQFLFPESKEIRNGKLILLGLLLLAIFFIFQYPYKLIGSFVVVMFYFFVSVQLFNSYGIIMSVIQPLLFIIISTAGMVAFDFYSEKKLNIVLRDRINQQAHQLKALEQKLFGFAPSNPYIKIIIPVIRLQNKCIFPHIIETSEDHWKDFPVFQNGLQVPNPLPIHIDQLNKLVFDIGLLWNDYAAYIIKKERRETPPIDKLRNIGRRIYRDFGLTATFNKLFKSSYENLYINFVVNDMRIPWQWAFDDKRKSFLCDRFPINISFATEQQSDFDFRRSDNPAEMAFGEEKGGILFYGDWKGHPGKELKLVTAEIAAINTRFKKNRLKTWIIYQDVEEFLNTIDQVIENQINIRIIHYSGHAEEEFLDVGEQQYLPPGTISQSRDLFFHSHPLVFLNACRAGGMKYEWEKYNNLATEFLACGAAACIVAFVDIFDVTAKKFSLLFYEHFIEHGLTVGQALRLTRIKMAEGKYSEPYNPDYDITRYFYNLYGDPMMKF